MHGLAFALVGFPQMVEFARPAKHDAAFAFGIR